MTSWFLIRSDCIQSDVSLHSEHTSPNTRHHRSQLSPVPDFTCDSNKYSLQTRSTWTHVPARIVFVAMNFSIKEGLHHIIVFDILSVKSWSVNSESSVTREFDCPYQYQKQTNYLCKYWRHLWREKRYKRHVLTWTTEIASWTLPRLSAVNGDSDNMKSDLSKTCLTKRFTTCRAHLRDEANWWPFSRTNLFLMKLSTCDSIASLFRKERHRWTILHWRGSRDDDQVFRKQEEESRSLQKKDPNDEDVDGTRDDPAQLSWQELYPHRNARRRRPRHVVCRCGNRSEVFDDFRRHVSVSFVASRTLPKDLRHWRRRDFVRRFLLRRMTLFILHS